MISHSETIAGYARAGWAQPAIDTVFPTDTRTHSGANVWIIGRHLSSVCQITLPVPHDLNPHPALKAAVELALKEQDIARCQKRLDNVWRRFGMFYVGSVEMGGMHHTTEMLDVSQTVCLALSSGLYLLTFSCVESGTRGHEAQTSSTSRSWMRKQRE